MHALRMLAVGAAAIALAACGQPAGGDAEATGNAAPSAAANTADATAPKHPTYCFYKDANTRGWAASVDKDGNIKVSGKAYLEDARYMGELFQGEVDGDRARIWLNMVPNTGAYAAPENWWDVSATIPGSAAATAVTVMCGTKTVANLSVKR